MANPGTRPTRALVLCAPAAAARHVREARVHPVDAVVCGVAVGAGLAIDPSRERGKALTLPPKLVDSLDAIRVRIAGACQGFGAAVGDRCCERSVCARSRIATHASVHL